MNELFRRLFRSKTLAAEIIVASLFVNVLFLASPIYVIQILSRYIGYGFDGTLHTLTAGMVIALVLWVAFTVIRTRMCVAVSVEPENQLQTAVLEALSTIKAAVLDRIPQNRLQQCVSAPDIVQSAYEATRITSVLDMPFFLLFVLAIFFLSPLLALITLLAVVMSILASIMSMSNARKMDHSYREESIRHRGSVNSAIGGRETVRAFNAKVYLQDVWERHLASLFELRNNITENKSWTQAATQGLSSLLKVAVYAVGAKQVVVGELTVGALIGVSILSAKALQISSGFMQTVLLMGKADDAMQMINEFISLPRDSATGTALKQFSGRLEFKDVAMGYPGASGPLFESLNVMVPEGAVLGVVGANGAGKTTFSKLVVGILDPARGQILADGIELRQLSARWWRNQVMYLPQEPTFLNGTIRDNITLAHPGIDSESLNKAVRDADLRSFLDTSAKGMETPVIDGGRSLPLGIRKRMALARALVRQSRLAVFDEPTEGLDSSGSEAVVNAMNELINNGVTIVVVSKDPNIMKGFTAVIDLDSKPVPKVGIVRKDDNEQGKA